MHWGVTKCEGSKALAHPLHSEEKKTVNETLTFKKNRNEKFDEAMGK